MHILTWGSSNFFCKGSCSKYVRFCWQQAVSYSFIYFLQLQRMKKNFFSSGAVRKQPAGLIWHFSNSLSISVLTDKLKNSGWCKISYHVGLLLRNDSVFLPWYLCMLGTAYSEESLIGCSLPIGKKHILFTYAFA